MIFQMPKWWLALQQWWATNFEGSWHLYFAWRPVRLTSTNTFAWGQFIRRRHLYNGNTVNTQYARLLWGDWS